jgi:hypothetical protein
MLRGDMNIGNIRNLLTYNNSTINISGGNVGIAGNGGGLGAFDNSTVNISGGQVGGLGKGGLSAYGSSTVNLSGDGYIERLTASYTSIVNIYGGSIQGVFRGEGNSSINITGGDLYSGLDVYDFSQVTISGRFYSPHLNANNNSRIIFYGSDFAIDGVQVAYGQYYASDFANGRITGTLINNSILDKQFAIYDNASIVLIPEPATLVLFSLGAVMLRKKR